MKRYAIFLFLLAPILFILLLKDDRETAVVAQSAADNSVYLPIVADNSLMVNWAFAETFTGDPAAPSQALLPDNFDYVVTHRTHPKEHFRVFAAYLADHDENCAGPNPDVSPLPQHLVTTSHESNGSNPDDSFYICKNHMMSSMGHVDGYSVTSFWPKQEFDFQSGGYLEFDVNLNDAHPRSWFEIMITPRSELKVGAASHQFPIDETYPKDRIVLRFFPNQKRDIQVGTAAVDPEGVIVEEDERWRWSAHYPNDPALNDRRIRRTMRVTLLPYKIIWSIEKVDGSFDDFAVDVPGGLPFTRGLVLFKTHAYTPTKDDNMNAYTFHWDNIRFSGPVVGRYENFEAEDVIYLQANGDRPLGDQETVTIDLPHIGPNPLLFGQVHNPLAGQVLLSVNGRSNIVVHPYDYNPGTCYSTGWKSFQLQFDPSWLKVGENTFKWTVGPRPSGCGIEEWRWDGFSIKDLEIQFDLDN